MKDKLRIWAATAWAWIKLLPMALAVAYIAVMAGIGTTAYFGVGPWQRQHTATPSARDLDGVKANIYALADVLGAIKDGQINTAAEFRARIDKIEAWQHEVSKGNGIATGAVPAKAKK